MEGSRFITEELMDPKCTKIASLVVLFCLRNLQLATSEMTATGSSIFVFFFCAHVNKFPHLDVSLCICFPLTLKMSVGSSDCSSMRSEFPSLICLGSCCALRQGMDGCVSYGVKDSRLWEKLDERWDFTQENANCENLSHPCAVLPDS